LDGDLMANTWDKQDGKPVAANLYIAIGISEQSNIAGISSSKSVINSDADVLSLKLLIMA
jgi:hypothetical protein